MVRQGCVRPGTPEAGPEDQQGYPAPEVAMSHSKGFLSGTCPGNFRNHGRPREQGDHMVQQQKCPRCGHVRDKRVRPCFLFHQWGSWGRTTKTFRQTRKCTRCGTKQTRQVPACFLWHPGWRRVAGEPGVLQCTRCGTKKEGESR